VQVAMMNQCLSQADAFFRAAIALIPSVPRFIDVDGKIRSTEPLLVDYIFNFLSTLVVVPDSPELGTLYLLRGLLNVVQDYAWDASSDSRAMIYIKVNRFRFIDVKNLGSLKRLVRMIAAVPFASPSLFGPLCRTKGRECHLCRVAGNTVRKVTAAYRRVYDSRHLQADCQEPGSAPEPYAR